MKIKAFGLDSQHDPVPEAMVGGEDSNETAETVGESGDQAPTDDNAATGNLPGATP